MMVIMMDGAVLFVIVLCVRMACRYAYASGALSGVTEAVVFSPFQVMADGSFSD